MGNDSLHLVERYKSFGFIRENKSELITLSLSIILLGRPRLCRGHVCDLGTKTSCGIIVIITNPFEEIIISDSPKNVFTVKQAQMRGRVIWLFYKICVIILVCQNYEL